MEAALPSPFPAKHALAAPRDLAGIVHGEYPPGPGQIAGKIPCPGKSRSVRFRPKESA